MSSLIVGAPEVLTKNQKKHLRKANQRFAASCEKSANALAEQATQKKKDAHADAHNLALRCVANGLRADEDAQLQTFRDVYGFATCWASTTKNGEFIRWRNMLKGQTGIDLFLWWATVYGFKSLSVAVALHREERLIRNAKKVDAVDIYIQ